MKGLTLYEVAVMRDAADPNEYNVEPSSALHLTVMRLAERGLIQLVPVRIDFGGEMTVEGRITPLGRMILSLVLTEPSLITS